MSRDLMRKGLMLRRILDIVIRVLQPEEANVWSLVYWQWHSWLRWLGPAHETPLIAINAPLVGYATREPHLGGTLYTWPENDPRLLIDAERERLRAEGRDPLF